MAKKYDMFKPSNVFLYLGFMVTLINIGYFIMIEEYQTIISFVVIISLFSMFTKNMFLLLLFGICGMNLFYMIKEDTIENMDSNLDMSYNSFKNYVINSLGSIDPLKLEAENKDFVLYLKSNQKMEPKEYYTEFKNKYREMSDTKWVDKNIINFKEIIIIDEKYKNTKMNESFKMNDSNEKGTDVESKEKIENIVDKLKETTPELSQSLDILNKIDINEMNKLINQMNTILQSA